MVIVGERINATRTPIQEALKRKDESFFLKEVRNQIKTGSDFIDVNAGSGTSRETEDLVWLIEIISRAFPEVKFSLDSASPDVIEESLAYVKRFPVMINSISAESKKLEAMLPLLRNHPEVWVVALTMDDAGIPDSSEGRIAIAERLKKTIVDTGVQPENIFFDGLVQPVGTDSKAFLTYLETLTGIKARCPGVRTICGLSNVSFGIPERKIVNKYALALALYAGLDGVIIDSRDPGIAEARFTVRALLGLDDYCLDYIKYYRAMKEKKNGA
jgi:cobalamin-dependent methionine synthase I